MIFQFGRGGSFDRRSMAQYGTQSWLCFAMELLTTSLQQICSRLSSGSVRVRFSVWFQAVKVPSFSGFPLGNPTDSATASKLFVRVLFGVVLSIVEGVVRVLFCCLLSRKRRGVNSTRTQSYTSAHELSSDKLTCLEGAASSQFATIWSQAKHVRQAASVLT